VNKLKRRRAAEGPSASARGNAGKNGRWREPPKTGAATAALHPGKYPGLNSRHFHEKLAEDEGIAVSYKAMHRILTSTGISSPKRQRKAKKENAHPTRPRRKGFGEPVQIDASLHPWFGSGLPKATPRGGIDDAAAPSWGSASTTGKRSPGIAGRWGRSWGNTASRVCFKDIRPADKTAFRPVFAQKIVFLWGS
jgi:hypothetical protein